jgi:electron transport complex protein RnfG
VSRNYLAQAWLVILLAILYGGGLAAVQITLGPRIAQNKKNETYHVIPSLVPGADEKGTRELMVKDASGADARVYQAFDAAGAPAGWVIPAGGQGFADRIELLVGLDARLTQITGLYVLDQKETPGLGDYITGEEFRARFRGKPLDKPVVIVKSAPQSPNEAQALTGATVSSVSVSAIVNSAVARLRDPLRRLAQESPAPPPASNPSTQ